MLSVDKKIKQNKEAYIFNQNCSQNWEKEKKILRRDTAECIGSLFPKDDGWWFSKTYCGDRHIAASTVLTRNIFVYLSYLAGHFGHWALWHILCQCLRQHTRYVYLTTSAHYLSESNGEATVNNTPPKICMIKCATEWQTKQDWIVCLNYSIMPVKVCELNHTSDLVSCICSVISL